MDNKLYPVAVHFNYEAVPLNVADITRFEQRLCVFSFVRTVWFYMPVLVHHIVVELRAAGAEQPHALAMSTLVIFSLGILLAEYPSGVFADWVGRKPAWRCRVSCMLRAYRSTLFQARCPSCSRASSYSALVLRFGLAQILPCCIVISSALGFRNAIVQRWRVCVSPPTAPLSLAASLAGCYTPGGPRRSSTASALCSLAALVPLSSLEEPPRRVAHRSYIDVLRESLAEVRGNGPARAIVLLGGVGVTFFLFVFWTTQSYLVGSVHRSSITAS